jgi:hypothetical protein
MTTTNMQRRGRPRLGQPRYKSFETIKPWLAKGMSRSTWYRRRAERKRKKSPCENRGIGTTDELDEIERQTLELARENIAAIEAIKRPTFEQEVERIWIINMARLGCSAEDARKLLAKRSDASTGVSLDQAIAMSEQPAKAG